MSGFDQLILYATSLKENKKTKDYHRDKMEPTKRSRYFFFKVAIVLEHWLQKSLSHNRFMHVCCNIM